MAKLITTILLLFSLSVVAYSERPIEGYFRVTAKNQNEFGINVAITNHAEQSNMLIITAYAPRIGRKGGKYSYSQIILKNKDKMFFYSRPSHTENWRDELEVSFLIDKSWLELVELNLIYQSPDAQNPSADPLDYYYSIDIPSYNGT
jgi:hypothetical protein